MLDSELIRLPWGARLLGLIQERDYRFDIQKQPHPHLVTFWREVTEAKDAQNKKVHHQNLTWNTYIHAQFFLPLLSTPYKKNI